MRKLKQHVYEILRISVCLFLVYLTSVHTGFMPDTIQTYMYIHRYAMLTCIAPRREHTSKALRYGTRSRGISEFYLHTPRSSANGVNHTCLYMNYIACLSCTCKS